MDLLKSSQNKRKLSELFSASTKPETAWKLFKAVFDLSPSGKAKVMKTHAKSNQRRIGVGIRPDQREVSGACE